MLTLEYTFISGTLTRLSPELRFSEGSTSAKTQAPTSLALAAAPGADRVGIFICGRSNGTQNGYYDYLVLGYPRDGNSDWVAYLDGDGHGDDFATKIVLGGDANNANFNVYVTGTSWSGTYNYDMVTMAMDLDGTTTRWVNHTHYGYDDYAVDLVTNNGGHVYVTGKAFSTSGTDFDYRTIKINSNDGTSLWTTSGPALYNSGGTDASAAVRILDDGDPRFPDVFVTGRSLAPTDQTQKYATMRYTQN